MTALLWKESQCSSNVWHRVCERKLWIKKKKKKIITRKKRWASVLKQAGLEMDFAVQALINDHERDWGMRVFPFSHSESPNKISHQFHHGDTIRGAVSAACFFFYPVQQARKRRSLDPCFIPCLLTCCLYVYTYIRGVCISGFYPFFSTTRGTKTCI